MSKAAWALLIGVAVILILVWGVSAVATSSGTGHVSHTAVEGSHVILHTDSTGKWPTGCVTTNDLQEFAQATTTADKQSTNVLLSSGHCRLVTPESPGTIVSLGSVTSRQGGQLPAMLIKLEGGALLGQQLWVLQQNYEVSG